MTRVKEECKILFSILSKTIERMTEQQLVNLIQGNGKLVYQELRSRSKINSNCDKKRIKKVYDKILAATTREDSVFILTKDYKLKKAELLELAELLKVHVLSKDNKEKLVERITESVVGVKIRKKAINEINLQS